MEIVSWNVNGLRACIRNGFLSWLEKENPDIVCLQELKLSEKPDITFKNYLTYWNISKRKGYSGVGVLTKTKPLKVIDKLGKEFDDEGRLLCLRFRDFWLVNAYFPNAGRGLPRLDFKLRFNREIEKLIKKLEKEAPVIITGDFNVAREEIDIANPKQNVKNAGFTPEEREWMNSFLEKGFIDTFRYFHKEGGNYTWWTYRFHARERNIGWRIDYFVVSKKLIRRVKDSIILKDVKGSDHCPIKLIYEG